jgi:recombination protein RecA
MYNEGISKIGSILDVATDLGFLEKRGSWFSFEGEQLGQGRDQTKALLASNPELCQKLYDKIMETIKATPGAGTKVDASE